MFKNKIFNFLKFNKLNGIIFRGVVFSCLSIFNWIDYSLNKNGMDLLGGIIFGLLVLFTIDDFYEYQKEKNKIIDGQ